MKELEKTYSPSDFEDAIYKKWCERGYFTPSGRGTPFTIVIPPPNVTGQLHMGHALDETLQDILVRYKRMRGFDTLWVPGTDHAGIATQIKVEEFLRNNEGITRYDLGREKFLERVWEWKNKYGSRIINQLKKLGSSCDWTRERFTMDEGCSKAVREVFVNLYNKGLIYRGNRIINWCPKCRTALSDAEVKYEEQAGHFWHIKYPVKGSDEYVIIATTRPETLLGDTAVAVNPDDERYTSLVGKTLILPLVGREIPVIADDYVDKEFGTGCVKITPAHDPNDFLVGQRHGLEHIRVMDDDATINANGGKYEHLDRYEARRRIIEDLEAEGLLLKTEDHTHNVGCCYRCGTTVEPLTSDQWFVKMQPLAEPAVKAVEDGEVRFLPERLEKVYMNWMNNVHDWCISRQLWWGHRIPAFYCDKCGKTFVSKTDLSVCPDCGAALRQEEDVLDTWFSSALWPFSTLGWPEDTEDLRRYYPTSVLVTGYDIIFFWVARMIFSGLEHTGKAPFSTVLFHGLVRDSQGRKMSKSLGNGIDPLEIIDKYGADALRFTLATGNSPGNDMRFSTEKVEAARNFANKIWNAARFVLMNLDTEFLPDEFDTDGLCDEDKWVVSLYQKLIKEVTDNFEAFELGVALSKLYDFIWDIFCDWYIELVKPRLQDKGSDSNKSAQKTLIYILSNTLKLLHPFMPFITEEIWQTLPHTGESIMISNYPQYDSSLIFEREEKDIFCIISAIKAVRNRRTEMNVPASKKARLYIATNDGALFEKGKAFFVKLASASEVIIIGKDETVENSVRVVTDNATLYIPMQEMVDVEKEKARLSAELERITNEIKRVEGKLGNSEFVSKAPEKVVNAEREKLEKHKATYMNLQSALEKLG